MGGEGLTRRQGLPPEIVARALHGAGLLAIRRLDLSRAKSALGEGLDLYQELGDGRGQARQTYMLGVLAWFEDDLEMAQELISQAEALGRKHGDDWALAWSLAVNGTMARLRGDLVEARRSMIESHQVFLDQMGALDIGWSLLRLGALARDEGRYAEAEERYTAGRKPLVQCRGQPRPGTRRRRAGSHGVAGWGSRHALDLYKSVLEGFSLSEEASNNLFELKTMIQGNPSTAELQMIVEANRGRARLVDGQAGARAARSPSISTTSERPPIATETSNDVVMRSPRAST